MFNKNFIILILKLFFNILLMFTIQNYVLEQFNRMNIFTFTDFRNRTVGYIS